MNKMTIRKALGLDRLKTLGAVVLSALLGAYTPLPAHAASNNQDVQTAYFGQLANSAIKLGGTVATGANSSAVSTTTVVMNLTYSGTAASAAITIGSGGTGGAQCITFYAPVGTIDSGIGSAVCSQSGGTFDLGTAANATMGQLCDLINGVAGPFALNGNANGGAPSGGSYHCTLVDSVRSDPTSAWLPTVTAAANVNLLNAVGGYQVPIATATVMSLGILPSPGRHVVLNSCVVNSAGTPSVQVFGVKAKDGIGGTSLSLFGVPQTDATVAWLSPALTANTSTLLPNFAAASTAVPPPYPWIEFGGGSGGYRYALNVPAGGAPIVPTGNAYNGHVVVRTSNYNTGTNAGPAQGSSNFITCEWLERMN